ncbi:hypothetical protein CQ13_29765 [Bradyrhizobium retamae]|uniref:Uncharacterized protein n=1 Tax=Bradyrhizobium retamae TaxID=1300035 RepID=A0A0R3MY89_9BRAD|nr:hypothetical protein CQ13_29765 [Bradyrhizobium retamae]
MIALLTERAGLPVLTAHLLYVVIALVKKVDQTFNLRSCLPAQSLQRVESLHPLGLLPGKSRQIRGIVRVSLSHLVPLVAWVRAGAEVGASTRLAIVLNKKYEESKHC